MPSLARGEESSSTDPVLDLYVENPRGTPVDVAALEFRVLDVSDAAKRETPVQVFPVLADQDDAPTWEVLDPTQAPDDDGHRLSLGRFYAPWTVPTDESVGDHRIEWRYKLGLLDEWEEAHDEFYVLGNRGVAPPTYCDVSDLRREGFPEATYSDARINFLAVLATRYIDKVTGRWFVPRVFDATNRMKVDGQDAAVLFLEVPVIRLDALYIEAQGFLDPSLTEIDLGEVRAYNRHLSGMTQPDDRENPKVAFVLNDGRLHSTVSAGLYPVPRRFPRGQQNVHLEGVFGYTDPDGSEFGETPWLIRQVAMRLVVRELLPESQYCEKFNVKVKHRIIGDREGSTAVNLQQLWLKGAFTGDPEIDQILQGYKRPPRMGSA